MMVICRKSEGMMVNNIMLSEGKGGKIILEVQGVRLTKRNIGVLTIHSVQSRWRRGRERRAKLGH